MNKDEKRHVSRYMQVFHELCAAENCAAEKGQAMVEFALIVSMMCILALVPLDLVRYAALRMSLNDVTASSLTNIGYDSLRGGNYEGVLYASLEASGEGRFTDLKVKNLSLGPLVQKKYNYRVYSSDKQNEANFSNRFENRSANYSYQTITLQTQCRDRALSPLGALFTGGMEWTVTSDPMTRNIYARGYKE